MDKVESLLTNCLLALADLADLDDQSVRFSNEVFILDKYHDEAEGGNFYFSATGNIE